MKKITVLLAICFSIAVTQDVFAQQKPQHEFSAGLEIAHIKYEEPGIMEEKGGMTGVNASYVKRGDLTFMVEGRVAGGEVDYENSGTMKDVDNFIFELRFMGGKDYPLSDGGSITPYIGFGYRYLNNDSSGRVSSTGAAGYERESNYSYLPIGVEMLSSYGNNWTIGYRLEYDFFMYGEQKSHLGDAMPGLNTVVNDQDEGYGFRGSLAISRDMGNTASIRLEPFIRYWEIKRSDFATITYYGTPVGIGYEPKNKSTEIGVNFSVTFFKHLGTELFSKSECFISTRNSQNIPTEKLFSSR